MKVRVIDNYKDFLESKETWESLTAKCEHSIFSTWEYLSTWWKHWGKSRKLLILIAEENGEPFGIAPLMQSTYKILGLPISKIEFIGTPHSDYHDLLLADRAEECIELFVKHLKNSEAHWDCIDLLDFPENSQYLPVLEKLFSKNVTLFHDCPYMPLPNNYETFMNGLSRNQRKNLNRTMRRLDETFDVEFVNCSKLGSISEGMTCLIELHQKRWESRGHPGVFSDPKVRNFHLELAEKLAQKGWLSLYLLQLSGKPVAADYGFKYRCKFGEYSTGFEPSFFKYNVGNVLRAHMIKEFIEEGVNEFDFMRGSEEYKERWNTTVRWNRRAVLVRKGVPSTFRYLFYKKSSYPVRRVKDLLKTGHISAH